MKKEAKACGNRCRIALSRQKRHAAVLDALRDAERALASAAAAVEALRKIAEGGPNMTATLAVPTTRTS